MWVYLPTYPHWLSDGKFNCCLALILQCCRLLSWNESSCSLSFFYLPIFCEMGLFYYFGSIFVFSRTDAPLLDKIRGLILAAQKLNHINLNPM
ncbi:hypothetical protein BO83DRAFT_78088 [Aspergillus eucalypticola CBS 122712]|uniref:Uncharacterized protein n=1 Tax=Aspergillus eucalypticola (strain CBS 122712 / IBT 29274) TaxID=1448314 RepID=A0A317WFG4_ASPEC|nr:uncharacterized protein BO83DRAFT_78088 [Aspergillus eucalypticola CBS 122712]PWY83982.1 hypothetical protein BO83DRAFT_78088 [Aspergillus eucalypticola CBS 122712]